MGLWPTMVVWKLWPTMVWVVSYGRRWGIIVLDLIFFFFNFLGFFFYFVPKCVHTIFSFCYLYLLINVNNFSFKVKFCIFSPE
ncbi:hypothetical protein CsatB_027716 [Cannabis sativa]